MDGWYDQSLKEKKESTTKTGTTGRNERFHGKMREVNKQREWVDEDVSNKQGFSTTEIGKSSGVGEKAQRGGGNYGVGLDGMEVGGWMDGWDYWSVLRVVCVWR